MSEIGTKTEISASNFELDSEDGQLQSKFRIYHIVNSARVGLTALALASAITILGVSANALAVYNETRVPESFLLPLWPESFDLRPTVALVVGSAIVIVVNLVSLAGSKLQSVRGHSGIHMGISFAGPIISFIAVLIAMSFFYAVNASNRNDSFQSWTCRWKDVGMVSQPHFGTLCKQSEAGLALTILLVPVEAIVLGMAAYQAVLERQLSTLTRGHGRKSGSPALS